MSPPGETATEVAGRAGTSPCLAHPTHPGPATDLGDGLGVTSHGTIVDDYDLRDGFTLGGHALEGLGQQVGVGAHRYHHADRDGWIGRATPGACRPSGQH